MSVYTVTTKTANGVSTKRTIKADSLSTAVALAVAADGGRPNVVAVRARIKEQA